MFNIRTSVTVGMLITIHNSCSKSFPREIYQTRMFSTEKLFHGGCRLDNQWSGQQTVGEQKRRDLGVVAVDVDRHG